MTQPTPSDVHIDRPLTNMSVAFRQRAGNFIASRVFPVVPVDKRSDKYFVFGQNEFFRSEMRVRPPATESAGMGYTLSSDSYSADVWALHIDISDQVRANSDAPLNPDRNATQLLVQQRLLRQELSWISTYFTTSVWGTDATPSPTWNDVTSDPLADMETAKRAIMVTTGFMANTLVLGYDAFRYLRHHPDIIDRVKYTSSENVTTELLARLFEVDRVLVAQAVKATNNEGETAAYDFAHGKHALLVYANPTPALEMPSAGYTFEWRGVSQGLGETQAVKKFRMEHIESDRIEIQAAWDDKVVSSALGYFFNGAVS